VPQRKAMLLEIENLTKVYRTGFGPMTESTFRSTRAKYPACSATTAPARRRSSTGRRLAEADRGSIRIDGADMIADPGLARRLCSFQA